jgi:hypothetical protein
MTVVWHGVPREMIGDTLFSLWQLRELDAELFHRQRQKYAGREATLDFRLPILGVRFNDTIHCSPVHPYRLFVARRQLGLNPVARPDAPRMTGLFFEIPVERILVHPVLWYRWRTLWINGAPDEDVPLTPPEDDFEPFEASRYSPLRDVTPSHLDYLVRMKGRGQPSLAFVHMPHVLVGGPIDIKGCQVVGWDLSPEQDSQRAEHA